jgi:PAS domain S-box-containing protein
MAALFKGGSKYQLEYRLKHRHGHWVWVYDRASVIQEGEVSIAYGIFSDITERKTAETELRLLNENLEKIIGERTTKLLEEIEERKNIEAALRESRENFRVLTEESILGIYIEQNKQVVYCNPALKQILRKSPKGGGIQDISTYLKSSSCHIYKKKQEQLATTPSEHSSFQVKLDAAEDVFLEVYLVPIKYQEQDALLGTMVDISQIKKVEAELAQKSHQLSQLNQDLEKKIEQEIKQRRDSEALLLQQSKLAAMGEMIGAIAHQWRQPINSLGIIIQDLKYAFEFGEFDKSYLDRVIQKSQAQINYMSKTIDDFRSFFKPASQQQSFSLQAAIKETLNLIVAQFSNNNIHVRLENFPNEDIIIRGYPNEFKQVIVNLLNNAKEALLFKAPRAKTQLEIIIELAQIDDIVKLKIIDQGIGVPTEVRQKIFEPYFTTKDKNHGTGIGLYMAKTIIEKNMAGKLYLDDDLTKTIFIIELEKDGKTRK